MTRDHRCCKRAAFSLCLLLWPWSSSNSQDIASALLTERWKAQWIRCPDAPRREFGVYHFRKTFFLSMLPEHLVIHASGENRYELFVNGKRALVGPARGDLDHWRYETTDVAPLLKAGKNVIAAVVWKVAELAPMAQMSNETGLIVQGNGTAEAVANTDSSWRSERASGQVGGGKRTRQVTGTVKASRDADPKRA